MAFIITYITVWVSVASHIVLETQGLVEFYIP